MATITSDYVTGDSTTGTWYSWCGSDTSTTTCSSSTAWTCWTNTTSSTDVTWGTWVNGTITYRAAREQTAEERAASVARQAEYAAQQEAERKRKAAADRRAAVLLKQNLDRKERARMKKEKCFYLRAPSGRRYKIDTTRTHGNVYEVDETGKHLRQLCVQPSGVPLGDQLLAQKLHIEHNEDEFRRIANITQIAAVG